jgi:SOS response regulatory protein OraA/RecX
MKTTTKSEYSRAVDSLSRYLALRDHSRHELQSKLRRRFAPELVEQVIAEAEERNLIAPPEQISERAALAWQRRLKSRRYIEAQLLKRRLPLPPRDDTQELETVRALVERKFGPANDLSYEDKGKVYRYLKFRGFDDRSIGKVLNGQE